MAADPRGQQECQADPGLAIERLQAWFNGILALTAVLGVVITSCQLSSMNRQLDFTVSSQRAWIGVDSASMEGLAPGELVQYRIELKNTGSAVGVMTSRRVGYIVCESKEEARRRAVEWSNDAKAIRDTLTMPLAPGALMTLRGTGLNPMDAAVVSEIESGNLLLLISFEIAYDRGNGGKAATSGCFLYNPVNDTFAAFGDTGKMD